MTTKTVVQQAIDAGVASTREGPQRIDPDDRNAVSQALLQIAETDALLVVSQLLNDTKDLAVTLADRVRRFVDFARETEQSAVDGHEPVLGYDLILKQFGYVRQDFAAAVKNFADRYPERPAAIAQFEMAKAFAQTFAPK